MPRKNGSSGTAFGFMHDADRSVHVDGALWIWKIPYLRQNGARFMDAAQALTGAA
jgi:hypothetical protein